MNNEFGGVQSLKKPLVDYMGAPAAPQPESVQQKTVPSILDNGGFSGVSGGAATQGTGNIAGFTGVRTDPVAPATAASLDAEDAARAARVADTRKKGAALGLSAVVTNPDGNLGTTGHTLDYYYNQTDQGKAEAAAGSPPPPAGGGSTPFAGVQGTGTPPAGATSPVTPATPGLIAGRMEPATVNSTNWNVDGSQLVENRAANIIADDSPLMQMARSRALQAANARGMINSSLAEGSAQAAVLGAATDIAKQDANTSAQSAQFNADSTNKAGMFNAGQVNQWNTNQIDRDFKTSERVDQQNWTSQEKALDRDATVAQYKFDAQTQKELKEISLKYQKDLDADSSFNDQYKMYVDALYKIDSDPNLDAPAKMQLKYQQAKAFESFAKLKGLKLDLDFSSQYEQGATTPAASGANKYQSEG